MPASARRFLPSLLSIGVLLAALTVGTFLEGIALAILWAGA